MVCDIICSSRCLDSYSNCGSNKNPTALQKRKVISSTLKNSRLRIKNFTSRIDYNEDDVRATDHLHLCFNESAQNMAYSYR